MRKGIYLLMVAAQGEVAVGRLGRHAFFGRYLYVGSARGPGGIKRVYLHLQVARGERRPGPWHIHSLLAIGRVETALFMETDQPLECLLAERLAQILPRPLPGFGSSDCRCPGHLFLLEKGLSPALKAVAALGLKYEFVPNLRIPSGRPGNFLQIPLPPGEGKVYLALWGIPLEKA